MRCVDARWAERRNIDAGDDLPAQLDREPSSSSASRDAGSDSDTASGK
jgi:hypothetical protein